MHKTFMTILLFALTLAACSQAPTDDLPGKQMPDGAIPCEGPRPEICTLEYMPVCGNDDQTYGNKCGACANPDVQYYLEGSCEDLKGETPKPVESDFVACQDPRPEACTREYMPVCGSKDNGIRCITQPCPSEDLVTYGNKCEACADPKVYGYTDGACAEEQDNNPADDTLSCAAITCPVGNDCVDGIGCVPAEDVPPCAATLCMVGSICVEGKGCVEQQLMVCADAEREAMAEQFGFTCVDRCPDGMDEFPSQLGPRCITHYGETEVEAWPTCMTATDCSEGQQCALATHTTDGQEFFTAMQRCVPQDYTNYLIHTVGLTTVDEEGQQSTVIA